MFQKRLFKVFCILTMATTMFCWKANWITPPVGLLLLVLYTIMALIWELR